MNLQHAIATVVLCSLLGCGQGDSGNAADTNPDTPPAGDPAAPAPTPSDEPDRKSRPITLEVVDFDGYQSAIDGLKGDVVVVDCWAMWCSECLKEFEHNVALVDDYEDQGVSLVTLSFDDDGQHEAALKFLNSREAHVTNLRVETGSSEESFETWTIPSGTLPHVKIYGRDGTLLKTFDAGDDPDAPSFGHEEVEAAVKEILAASPPG